MASVPQGAVSVRDSLVDFRRELHRSPELRFQEHRTAARIAERLRRSGFAIRSGVAGTGVVASLAGDRPGPHILLRADMDALPTPDLKQVPYASRVPGVTHACGHDVHMAVVVGAGEALAASGSIRGRLTLLFQPAEEIPFGEGSGARAVIETRLLDEPTVDVALGLHCWPSLPVGEVGVDRFVAMGAKDAFRIRIVGTGVHAATPSQGRDAILAISELVVSLHHLIGREIDPGERAAVNVGTIQGGSSQSIVPAVAEITGTLRTVDPRIRSRLRASIERVAGAAAMLTRSEHQLEWANEMPPLRNDPALVERAVEVLPGVAGVAAVRLLDQPPMTADDFALYAERVPALYMKLGVCGAAPGSSCPPLHDGRFDVDERAIDTGVAALSALAADVFARPVESEGL